MQCYIVNAVASVDGSGTGKLQSAYDEVMALIAHLEEILNNDEVCWNLIKSELIEVRDKYGDERKTDIDYTAGIFLRKISMRMMK